MLAQGQCDERIHHKINRATAPDSNLSDCRTFRLVAMSHSPQGGNISRDSIWSTMMSNQQWNRIERRIVHLYIGCVLLACVLVPLLWSIS